MRVLVFSFVLFCAVSAHAQNPCTAAAPSTPVGNPRIVYAILPEHTVNEIDGGPRVTDYQVAYFAQGANPETATPVVGPVTLAKAAFVPVTGAQDCYRATVTPAVPATGVVVASLKARRTARTGIDPGESPWSAVSNPFGVVPSALAAPGRITIGQ